MGKSGDSAGGQALEDLVAAIERALLPEGFDVQTRVRVLDADGVQTAELDVQVTGQLGSSSVRWVFECRDRPSSGPAGVDWIEQLVTRRQRLKVDRLFAVSTTGFSPAAKGLAESSGIQLRTVTTLDDIENEFKIQTVTLQWSVITAIGVIDVRTEDPNERLDSNSGYFALRFANNNEEFRGVLDFLDDNTTQGVQEIPGDQHRVFLTERAIELRVRDRTLMVRRLRIPYTVTTHVQTTRAVAARLYAEDEREIGREGDFEIDVDGSTMRTRVRIIKTPSGDDEMQVSLEGEAMQQARRLTIYGHN